MAAPNIVNVTTITGKHAHLTPSVNTAVVLLANPASSGKVLKINKIVAANQNSSALAATVSYYTNGAVAQGSAPSGGTAFPVISAGSVPGNASLVVSDRNTCFYMEENTCLSVTSALANNITFTVSYEEIS